MTKNDDYNNGFFRGLEMAKLFVTETKARELIDEFHYKVKLSKRHKSGEEKNGFV